MHDRHWDRGARTPQLSGNGHRLALKPVLTTLSQPMSPSTGVPGFIPRVS
jgi:hypothetical protein